MRESTECRDESARQPLPHWRRTDGHLFSWWSPGQRDTERDRGRSRAGGPGATQQSVTWDRSFTTSGRAAHSFTQSAANYRPFTQTRCRNDTTDPRRISGSTTPTTAPRQTPLNLFNSNPLHNDETISHIPLLQTRWRMQCTVVVTLKFPDEERRMALYDMDYGLAYGEKSRTRRRGWYTVIDRGAGHRHSPLFPTKLTLQQNHLAIKTWILYKTGLENLGFG